MPTRPRVALADWAVPVAAVAVAIGLMVWALLPKAPAGPAGLATPTPLPPPPDQATTLMRLIPDDALVAYRRQPTAADAAQANASPLALLQPLALFSQDLETALDLAAPLPVLTARPHAVALLQLSARRIPAAERKGRAGQPAQGDATKLDRLQLAIVVHVGEEPGPVVDCVAGVAKGLARKGGRLETVTRPGWPGQSTQRLVSERFPEWASLEWGPLAEGAYAVCLGEGTFDRLLAVQRDSHSTVLNDAMAQRAELRLEAHAALMVTHVQVARLAGGLGSVMGERPEEILRSLSLQDADRVSFTLGLDGRAATGRIWVRSTAGQEWMRDLCAPAPPEVLAVIPPQASVYAYGEHDLPWLARAAWSAVVAGQSPEDRLDYAAWWEEMNACAQAGSPPADLSDDLVSRLGPRVFAMAWPEGPLGPAFSTTLLIQHDGSPGVAPALDGLMRWWQRHLAPKVNLQRFEDGTWSVNLVVLRPAVAVMPTHLLVSWSPEAIRQVRRLSAPEATPTPLPIPAAP